MMNVEYVAFGNVMLDEVLLADGTQSRAHIGGPSTFAYSGIKLWTDKVMQSSKVGEDFHPLFDPWIEKNDVIKDGFDVVCEHSNHSFLTYLPDGTYGSAKEITHHRSDWIQDFGYMKTTPEQIDYWTKDKNIKGIYLAQNCDRVWWRKLKEVKQRNKFKFMWEIEGPSSYKQYLDDVVNAMESVDIFSINIQECQNLFDVKGDEACIEQLQKMPVDFTLFRVGDRGLYAVTKDEVHYLPPAPSDIVKDPTGCGNTSTGSALYAYCEGKDPLMIGIMANVASAQNIRQFGVIPDFRAVREFAYNQAEELYKQYKK